MEPTNARTIVALIVIASLKFDGVNLFMMLSHDQQYVVDAGAQLSLTCVFYKDKFNLFDNPVQWKKYQFDEKSEINILGNIKEPFDSTGRFKVTYEPSAPQYTMGLTIKNLSRIDSGNYTCEVRAPRSAALGIVKYTVHVKDPVADVYVLQSNNSWKNASSSTASLTFVERRPTPVRCIARGGSPPPEMEIFLGADDYTDYFRYVTAPALSGSVGFRTLEMSTMLITDDFRADAEDDGKRFKCIAKVLGLKKVFSSTPVIVNYAPKISCQVAFAYLGDRNVRLTCDVRARPALTSWFWVLDENGTTIAEGEVIDGYWTVVTRLAGKLHLELYVREATRHSFRRYSLIAENFVATERKQISLERLYRDAEAEPRSQDDLPQREKHASVPSNSRATVFSSSAATNRSHAPVAILLLATSLCFVYI